MPTINPARIEVAAEISKPTISQPPCWIGVLPWSWFKAKSPLRESPHAWIIAATMEAMTAGITNLFRCGNVNNIPFSFIFLFIVAGYIEHTKLTIKPTINGAHGLNVASNDIEHANAPYII